MKPLLLEDVRRIVASVTFPGYEFDVAPLDEGRYTINARFKAPCAVNGGEPVWQYTRTWLLDYPCESAVVGTCLKLVLTSIEHEAREVFRYAGFRVFDPHTPVRDFIDIQVAKAIGRIE